MVVIQIGKPLGAKKKQAISRSAKVFSIPLISSCRNQYLPKPHSPVFRIPVPSVIFYYLFTNYNFCTFEDYIILFTTTLLFMLYYFSVLPHIRYYIF